jgi:hypothetical protein
MLGQFYWTITTKGWGVKTWVGNFVVGQKNKWFKWHSSKVTIQSWSHGVGCQISVNFKGLHNQQEHTHVTMNSWGLWASRLFMCAQAGYLTNNPLYGVPSLRVIWNTKEHELLWGLDDHQIVSIALRKIWKYENVKRQQDTWYNLSKRSGSSRLHYSHLLGSLEYSIKKKRLCTRFSSYIPGPFPFYYEHYIPFYSWIFWHKII